MKIYKLQIPKLWFYNAAIAIMLIVLFIFGTNKSGSLITGFFVFDNKNKLDNTSLYENLKDDSVNLNEETINEETINEEILNEESNGNDMMISNFSSDNNILSFGSSKRSGGKREIDGYKINNLDSELSLFFNDYFLNPSDILKGNFRFGLYKNSYRVADFDLNVNQDLDFSDLIVDINITNKKSYVHTSKINLKNVDLYVPRNLGQLGVRICENATSYDQIFKGCLNDSLVTSEYYLEIGDPRLNISFDEQFFIVKNVTGTGGVSEGLMVEDDLFNIELISPGDNSGSFDNLTSFEYNVNGNQEIINCKLIVDDKVANISYDVQKKISNIFTINNLKRGKHYWEIVCSDNENNKSVSLRRKITIVPVLDYFDIPNGVDLSNIENVNNLSFKKLGFGLIRFIESINLSTEVRIEDFIEIKENFIRIDSKNIPEFNKPAELTFYNLDLKNPIILRNGKPCLDCEVISNHGDLVFRVSHFSNYSATENSQLEIWDDTDNNRLTGGNIYFYANYTNVTDNNPIIGASCDINFDDFSSSLSYNASSKLFEYNRTFPGTGIYSFNISCSAAGFTEINLTDYSSIQGVKGPNGANVTVIKTERGAKTSADLFNSYAKNITEINIDGGRITNSWQGYIGNVSGTIDLTDNSNNVLYNWTAISLLGEIYATRSYDINFVTISCASALEIIGEESFLNQSSSEVDSVTNTFYEKNHPNFYVGGILINQNNCNSTNIYSPGGSGSDFIEVLLADGASNIVYTTLLEQETLGFDNNHHDFEMIVGENGKLNNEPTTYYFYVEFT